MVGLPLLLFLGTFFPVSLAARPFANRYLPSAGFTPTLYTHKETPEDQEAAKLRNIEALAHPQAETHAEAQIIETQTETPAETLAEILNVETLTNPQIDSHAERQDETQTDPQNIEILAETQIDPQNIEELAETQTDPQNIETPEETQTETLTQSPGSADTQNVGVQSTVTTDGSAKSENCPNCEMRETPKNQGPEDVDFRGAGKYMRKMHEKAQYLKDRARGMPKDYYDKDDSTSYTGGVPDFNELIDDSTWDFSVFEKPNKNKHRKP